MGIIPTQEQIDKIVLACKERVDANRVAYIHEVIRDIGMPQVEPNFLEIISHKVADDPKYISEKNNQIWCVRINREYELTKSLKDTNTSIQTLNNIILPKNFEDQRKFGNKTLLLTLISVVFIGLTLYQQYRDRIESKVQELSHKSDSLRKELKNIQSSLLEIDSSIQKITTDTILVRKKRR